MFEMSRQLKEICTQTVCELTTRFAKIRKHRRAVSLKVGDLAEAAPNWDWWREAVDLVLLFIIYTLYLKYELH